MIITNKYGMPPQLVRAVEKVMNSHPRFDENTFSVTELLKSPQQIVLSRQHYNEIEIDVVDTYPMWHGLMIHKILEECADDSETIAEERLEYPLGNGLTLSGGFDALDRETWELYDYKTTKKAKYNNNMAGTETSWINQLRMYAIMIENQYGRRPQVAHIIAMLNDYSKVQGDIGANDMPKHNVMRIDWNLKVPSNREEIEEENEFIAEFADKAEVARAILRGEDSVTNHPCTYGDCWCKEDYAVMKEGRKTAIRRFDNEADARAKYEELKDGKDGDKLSIHHRISEPTNCAHYCLCAEFCKQWQMMKGHDLDEDITENKMAEGMPF